jgi:hypothetical protein
VVVGLAATMLNNNSAVASVLSNLAFLCLWVSIGVAVLKYRLYEIDIVISRAVLYGSLAVFITAVYVGLVAGVGTLVGNRRSALLSALAAAVVAVAFQPLRHRAGRLANRVVYGRRATPYEVLSDFSRRVGGAYSSEDVLPQMARIVAAGTGAEQVVIWLRVGDELHAAASSSGQSADAAAPHIDGDAMPALPGADVSVPVVHQGRLLGAISIQMSRAEPLRPAGEHLVTDLASQAGLVLANAGLIEDLRSSRQRLVTAQGRGAAAPGAQRPRRGPAGPGRPGHQTRPGRGNARRGHGGDQTDPAAAAVRRRGGAGEHPRPGPGHLPAAAVRPGAGRRAERAGRQVHLPRDGPGRRDRAVIAGCRGRRLFLLP